MTDNYFDNCLLFSMENFFMVPASKLYGPTALTFNKFNYSTILNLCYFALITLTFNGTNIPNFQFRTFTINSIFKV